MLPITVVKNGIRIVVLSLLSVHVPRIIEGQLHREGGVPFFALALAMLLPVFLVLRRMENSRATVVDETRTVVSL